jgi:hypothetical protein
MIPLLKRGSLMAYKLRVKLTDYHDGWCILEIENWPRTDQIRLLELSKMGNSLHDFNLHFFVIHGNHQQIKAEYPRINLHELQIIEELFTELGYSDDAALI